MSQTFTPTAKFSINERDWQAEIGGVVGPFLKDIGCQGGSNMSQLKKLPKFGTCGVLSEGENNLVQPSPAATAPVASTEQSDLPAFIPTRKVREQPGGGSSQIASLLGGDRQSDAMNWVPPPIAQQSSINPVEAPSAPTAEQTPAPAPEEEELPRVMMPNGSASYPLEKSENPLAVIPVWPISYPVAGIVFATPKYQSSLGKGQESLPARPANFGGASNLLQQDREAVLGSGIEGDFLLLVRLIGFRMERWLNQKLQFFDPADETRFPRSIRIFFDKQPCKTPS
ncbi:hypothetical protein KEM48_005492 [Puccinia striiformis f. sp. tritici PST-130]|nr:hypothetical protein KEM48_005492 [Puccinia striiformis f. sp. tritici PST-130]